MLTRVLAVSMLLVASGCVRHGPRRTFAVCVTEAESGEPVKGATIFLHEPIRLLPLPPHARAWTDSQGAAVLRIADGMWIGFVEWGRCRYPLFVSVDQARVNTAEVIDAVDGPCAAIRIAFKGKGAGKP